MLTDSIYDTMPIETAIASARAFGYDAALVMLNAAHPDSPKPLSYTATIPQHSANHAGRGLGQMLALETRADPASRDS
jgi:hypothetical protein